MAILMILLTVVVYLGMNRLYRRYRFPFLIPTLTTTLTMVVLLMGFKVPYKTYMVGGQWINLLLGPSIVALAYPLYNQRMILIRNLIPIVSGVLVGSVFGIISGLLFANYLGVERSLVISIVPKSITIPVAMQIAAELGGIPPLAAVFVMIAGLTGAVFGPYIFKMLKINHFLGMGMALGSASHAIGISKASEYGERTVSISSVAMTLSAISGAIFGPLIVWLFYV